jgi:hypothetical protein
MLPCFFILFVFPCSDLCTCWDGYHFSFYNGVFLVNSLLLRALCPILFREDKTTFHESKTTIQVGSIGGLKDCLVKGLWSVSLFTLEASFFGHQGLFLVPINFVTFGRASFPFTTEPPPSLHFCMQGHANKHPYLSMFPDYKGE